MVKWLILCGNEENWDLSIKQTVWGVKPNLRRLWNDVLDGDIVFFYVTRVIKRIIGVGRVKEKLNPQVYPPKPLWSDEIMQGRVIYPYRFKFDPIHVCGNPLIQGVGVEGLRISKQKGMSRIIDKEAIGELHRRVKLEWNLDIPMPEVIIPRAPRVAEKPITLAPYKLRDVVGEPIHFRDFVYAPLNEAGVILLFSKVMGDLGIIYESSPPTFPDLVARRRTERGYERVYIEFEYKSTNFIEHKHDPSQCDIIVCWEHDWKDCPIEVIELKEVIRRLQREGRA